MKEDIEEGMKEEAKEEIKEEKKIEEKAHMKPTPGELMVMRAIRSGACTKTKIYKNFGRGIAKEIIDDFMNTSMRDNFVILSNGRYFLSPKGVNAVLKYELEKRPIFPTKTKEVVADKIVGGVLIALGLIILIIGFQFAIGIFNTSIPQITQPSGDFGQVISYYLEIMCEAYIPVSFQFLGTLLVVYIGGSVLSKGVHLFKR